MKTEEVASPNWQEIQQALSSIQSELYKHRGAHNRIERRLTDIVWFIIIFFVLDVVAQQVVKL